MGRQEHTIHDWPDAISTFLHGVGMKASPYKTGYAEVLLGNQTKADLVRDVIHLHFDNTPLEHKSTIRIPGLLIDEGGKTAH